MTPNATLNPGIARTFLFVPGDQPSRFDKARQSVADEIIIDLEDAVALDLKDDARDNACHWLSDSGEAWVRINAVGTPYFEKDVRALAGISGLRGLVVPKADDSNMLEELGQRIGPAEIIALVESARGVRRAWEIAECAAVSRLAFGSIDLAYDIVANEDDRGLLFARSTVVLASRAAAKPSPIDGVTAQLYDRDAVARDVANARKIGFGGKLCLHPSQLEAATVAFLPTDEEINWARKILAAVADAEGSAVRLNGCMVDRPVVLKAQQILAS